MVVALLHLLWLATPAPAAASTVSPVRVTTLRSEYAVNPLGLDTPQPRLSWILESARRGERQTAYQVLVAESREALDADRGDLWDSGRVESDRSAFVAYAGRALTSRQRAHWKVKVWDKDKAGSRWSEPAFFEMGLLAPADWAATWVGRPASTDQDKDDSPLKPADGVARLWISGEDPKAPPPDAVRSFRGSFDLPSGRPVAGASLFLSIDNRGDAWVNGQRAASLSPKWDWQRFTRIPVTRLLREGRNSVAVRAINVGGGASMAAVVQITFADGSVQHVKTSADWRGVQEAPAGWTEASFDDRKWPAAVVTGQANEANAWDVRPYVSPDSPPATYLRKEFALGSGIRRARVYASAKGLYVLQVNGRRVGEDFLRPGWTDYRDRFQYQTYDVTALLKAGDNAVGVVLGDGWYAGHVADMGPRDYYGPATRALVQIEVERADGTGRAIVTDGSWQHDRRAHPDVRPPHGRGLRRAQGDAGLGHRRIRRLRVDSRRGRAARQRPSRRPGRPQREEGDGDPGASRSTRRPAGAYVFDLGQNMVGWARLDGGKARREPPCASASPRC